jgi:hypothetical protein
MKRICAWCGLAMDSTQPPEMAQVTHGVCPACRHLFFGLAKAKPEDLEAPNEEPGNLPQEPKGAPPPNVEFPQGAFRDAGAAAQDQRAEVEGDLPYLSESRKVCCVGCSIDGTWSCRPDGILAVRLPEAGGDGGTDLTAASLREPSIRCANPHAHGRFGASLA